METSPPLQSPSAAPQKSRRTSVIMFLAFLLIGLIAGGLVGYAVIYSDFNQKISNLQSQIGLYQEGSNSSQQTFFS